MPKIRLVLKAEALAASQCPIRGVLFSKFVAESWVVAIGIMEQVHSHAKSVEV